MSKRIRGFSVPCLQNEEDAFRKVRLRVEDVQGRNCLANFWVSSGPVLWDRVRVLGGLGWVAVERDAMGLHMIMDGIAVAITAAAQATVVNAAAGVGAALLAGSGGSSTHWRLE